MKKTKVHPVAPMILIVEDGDKTVTKGGIILPDIASIPTLTGRIIRMPDKIKENQLDYPFVELDRIIYNPNNAVPVDLEPGNKYCLLDVSKVLGVIVEEDEDEGG